MRNLILSVLLCWAVPALSLAAEDPPSRVARLSHIDGEVSMAPAGTQEWAEAVLNRPLTSEDRVWVDRGGRAELQIGSATVHLDESTEFAFTDLEDDAMTMNLTEGRTTIRIVRKRDNEAIEVNTPNASVSLLHPGEYTIEVNEDGDQTIVKARSGAAEVVGEEKTYQVQAEEVGVFRGTAELTADINRVGPRTAFENWANDRSRRNERSASSRYVGEGVIGYEDLDEHGRWVHEPEYGHVWAPTYVVSGWAPYRYGRWAWVSPWGWTWIDDARWGFAPFHYGRWAFVRHRWCWVPGPRHVRAVYAPALVAWTTGPHVSVNVSFGSVGWFPLGPREVYVPGYWHTRRYIHNVNVSNTIIVNNTYINNAYRGRYRDLDYRYRQRRDAVTVVDREHFVRGRPLEGRYARVEERDLRNWRHEARPPAIAPQRDSVRAAQPRNIDRDRGDRQVVARRAMPTRVNFDQERTAIEANGGRPITRSQLLDRGNVDANRVRLVRGDTRNAAVTNDGRSGAGPEVRDSIPSRQRIDRDPRELTRERAVEARSRSGEQRLESRQRVESEARSESPQRIETLRGRDNGDAERARASASARSRELSGGSAPRVDRDSRIERSERNSADLGAEQRMQRHQQQRTFEAQSRQMEQQRESAREAQRAQRESWQRDRAPAVESRRSEPSSSPSPQQIERSAPAPRSMPQPRSERQPSGGGDQGRSSQHSRGGGGDRSFERGNSRDR